MLQESQPINSLLAFTVKQQRVNPDIHQKHKNLRALYRKLSCNGPVFFSIYYNSGNSGGILLHAFFDPCYNKLRVLDLCAEHTVH
ncbi:hypothetical protein D3C80_1338610 [compost metagenome]